MSTSSNSFGGRGNIELDNNNSKVEMETAATHQNVKICLEEEEEFAVRNQKGRYLNYFCEKSDFLTSLSPSKSFNLPFLLSTFLGTHHPSLKVQTSFKCRPKDRARQAPAIPVASGLYRAPGGRRGLRHHDPRGNHRRLGHHGR